MRTDIINFQTIMTHLWLGTEIKTKKSVFVDMCGGLKKLERSAWTRRSEWRDGGWGCRIGSAADVEMTSWRTIESWPVTKVQPAGDRELGARWPVALSTRCTSGGRYASLWSCHPPSRETSCEGRWTSFYKGNISKHTNMSYYSRKTIL